MTRLALFVSLSLATIICILANIRQVKGQLTFNWRQWPKKDGRSINKVNEL